MDIDWNFSLRFHFGRKTPSDESTGDDTPDENRNAAVTLAEALALAIEQAERLKSPKTIYNYRTAMRSFLRFMQGDEPLCHITANNIGQYERWLRDQGVCPNTASCYMRSLRAMFKTVDDDTDTLFSHVFTGSNKTNKRAVTLQVMSKLKNLNLPEQSYLALARDVFLFCFFAQGMPFVDAAHLRHSHIVGSDIIYYRHKTGQRICIALLPCMTDIIERHKTEGSDRVFPLLAELPGHDPATDYLYQLNRYNRALKVIARKAGINCNLTSYVARHTWASEAYRKNVDLPVISKALGHTNPNTTLVYVKELDDSRLKEANKQVLDDFT